MPKHTSITFYGGLNTIGGVIMDLRYDHWRVLLELGLAVQSDHDYLSSGFHDPELIRNAVQLGSIPAIPGFYSRKDLCDLPLPSAEEFPYHTISLITHLHLDHIRLMGLAADDIDLFLSENAQKIFCLLQDVEPIDWHRTKGFKTMQDHETITCGPIRITPYLLNPDGYQEFSFYVETPDLKLHYTGDLNTHARWQDNCLKEMAEVASFKPDTLVVDTTTFMDSTMKAVYGTSEASVAPSLNLAQYHLMNEADWLNWCDQTVQEISGKAAFVNFYHRELHYYPDWMRLARAMNRQLVLDPEAAWLWSGFTGQKVSVWIPDNDFYNCPQKPSWLENVLRHNPVISAQEISAHPEKYLLDLSFRNTRCILHMNTTDALYIHIDGEPIDTYDPRYQQMKELMDSIGIQWIELRNPATFNHSFPFEIQYYVDEIGAAFTIPTHGFNPERLHPDVGTALLPQLGVTYAWRDGQWKEGK